ncbi:hypothetical protein AB0G04_33810 [Actinoplanes sp. NPDC023801]|uniref:RCC1 domain-containing protein n=1 Tax=Actinoplanes sp. NPDC023801 TaxID=3154595 RepID=UPI0033D98218
MVTAGKDTGGRFPGRVSADTDWASVSIGGYHVCGVRTDGTLWCWEERASLLSETRPSRVGTRSDWRSVAAGLFYTCAVDTGDGLWCWGRNLYGELGDGTSGTERAAPTRIAPENRWATVLTGGGLHTCALDTGGRTWCWGRNDDGQIGDGSTRNATRPVRIGSDANWKSISPGTGHTCALSVAGALWCWGDDSGGQLGDGTYTTVLSSTAPLRVGTGTGWDRVAPADGHTCALRTDRSLWCWGGNEDGELGDGTTASRSGPVQVTGGKVWTAISADAGDSCGLRTDGSLWCWGDRFGDPDQPGHPRRMGRSSDWTGMDVGSSQLCATRADGSVWCWSSTGPAGEPVRAAGSGARWVQVTTGGGHACARDTAGKVFCWGSNDYGQLGDGDRRITSVPVVKLARAAATVEGGSISTCAVGTDRSLWCWGGNRQGQLGDGDTMDMLTPVRVGGASDWTGVSISGEFACGTRADASVWCWGDNYRGQLGDGSRIERHSPVRAGTAGGTWLSVGTGLWHTCAIRTDRSLWCWGDNESMQLGTSTVTRRPVPVPAT